MNSVLKYTMICVFEITFSHQLHYFPHLLSNPLSLCTFSVRSLYFLTPLSFSFFISQFLYNFSFYSLNFHASHSIFSLDISLHFLFIYVSTFINYFFSHFLTLLLSPFYAFSLSLAFPTLTTFSLFSHSTFSPTLRMGFVSGQVENF